MFYRANLIKEKPAKNNLSRKDFIIFFFMAQNSSIVNSCLTNGILLGLLGLTALRICEAVQIQVKDFILDEKGLLKDLGNGFGQLVIPSVKSNGGYSPSHFGYHIAIVPAFRKLINMHLKSDFMRGYTAETYLLRKHPVREYDDNFDNIPPERHSLKYASWLKKVKRMEQGIIKKLYLKCALLLETKVEGTVSSYDFRRSCYYWIKSTPSRLPPNEIHRVANIHLRYRQPLILTITHHDNFGTHEYMECIENALNFPWDFNALKVWEEQRCKQLED